MNSSWSQLVQRVRIAANTRLGRLAGGRWAVHCQPVAIMFLLSERCNARCVHCDIWKNRGKESAPTAEQWKAVLHDLRRWLGRTQVVFTGGEALLQPYAIELVRYASEIGLVVEHLTHGYWLDQSKIEQLGRAAPWRVTMSLDGIGAVHDRVRGRERFFEVSERSIETLRRVRQELKRPFAIRLKTVIMDQNVEHVHEVAEFARERGLEVFYQPIEQNYNTEEDPTWYEHSATWPRDPLRAVAAVERLREMKRQGYPIRNSDEQLAVMIPYFRDPAAMMIATQHHVAHVGLACSAVSGLQFQSNGDVRLCWRADPVGNIKQAPIREIWANRPRLWQSGCCLEQRLSEDERAHWADGARKAPSASWSGEPVQIKESQDVF